MTISVPALSDFTAYEISTSDMVVFQGALNQPFVIDFELATAAFAIGPFEAWTEADFGSTGSYSLEAFDPSTGDPLNVTFNAVPEPAALAAMAVLLVGMGRRRSR
ncbi:MAG: hypothetical protein CMJ18_18515 [Phycisphaeraceae bacterium]|nr:hypothetical protein [Phycisphaeraceae bacterium]